MSHLERDVSLSFILTRAVYYGISLNVSDLGSNLFWSTFWSGLIEFPSYLSTLLLLRLFGRRFSLILIMAVSGVSCLAVIPFYTFVPMNHTIVQIFALLGKSCVTGSFALIYVYSCEVYPTKFRQISLGSCSTFARFGSILSPFMKEMVSGGVVFSHLRNFSLSSRTDCIHQLWNHDGDLQFLHTSLRPSCCDTARDEGQRNS